MYGSIASPTSISAFLRSTRVEICRLPTYFTWRSIGRSTTWKMTTTPSRMRTYFGFTSTNLRLRWSERTSCSIACGSKIWPARVTSCGNLAVSVA